MDTTYDNKIIQIGDIVRYKNPYPDEIGTTYKVVECEYVLSHARIFMEAIVPMNIKPLYTADSRELEVIK
jgi:hypothetical protein